MIKSRRVYLASAVLLCLGIVAAAASLLALIDISQGIEPDLSLEWMILRVAFPVIIIALISGIAAAVTAIKRSA